MMMLDYTPLDFCWFYLIPYLLIGATALPIILAGILYGWLQLFLIFIGLIDAELIHKNFLIGLIHKLSIK